ncbi:hypothetical protein ACFWYW_51010 [Nonomuraea sp. NPDC059023]|uniref:hypothetical protein n=1 Tax=unclassified Nonomuraea TaxID=2593643 RepID=UPI0036D1F183
MRMVRVLLGVLALTTLLGLIAPAYAQDRPDRPADVSLTPTDSPTSEAVDDPEPAVSAAAACSVGSPNGYVYIYRYANCGEQLCRAEGDDLDYSNDKGCAGSDNDKASSVVNRGFANGWGVVRLYRHAGASGGEYICVNVGSAASELSDEKFLGTNVVADNRISSHAWVQICPGYAD